MINNKALYASLHLNKQSLALMVGLDHCNELKVLFFKKEKKQLINDGQRLNMQEAKLALASLLEEANHTLNMQLKRFVVIIDDALVHIQQSLINIACPNNKIPSNAYEILCKKALYHNDFGQEQTIFIDPSQYVVNNRNTFTKLPLTIPAQQLGMRYLPYKVDKLFYGDLINLLGVHNLQLITCLPKAIAQGQFIMHTQFVPNNHFVTVNWGPKTVSVSYFIKGKLAEKQKLPLGMEVIEQGLRNVIPSVFQNKNFVWQDYVNFVMVPFTGMAFNNHFSNGLSNEIKVKHNDFMVLVQQKIAQQIQSIERAIRHVLPAGLAVTVFYDGLIQKLAGIEGFVQRISHFESRFFAKHNLFLNNGYYGSALLGSIQYQHDHNQYGLDTIYAVDYYRSRHQKTNKLMLPEPNWAKSFNRDTRPLLARRKLFQYITA